MMNLYEMVELKDGEPVQFLAVYTLRWRPEWGQPEVGFREAEQSAYTLDDALNDLTAICFIYNNADQADDARAEVIQILKKLAGEES